MLLAAIMPLNLLLSNFFLENEICLVGETSQHNFITSQMYQGVREKIKDFCKDLSD